MNRRHFLRLFGAAATVALVDPERLVWTPGATTHVLPPPSGWRRPSFVGLFNPPSDIARQYRVGLLSEEWATSLNPPYPPHVQEMIASAAKALADRIDAEAIRTYRSGYFKALTYGGFAPAREVGYMRVQHLVDAQREMNVYQSITIDRIFVPGRKA